MTQHRDITLIEAARRGDRRARDCLVVRHLAIVRSLAGHYRDLGLPYDDLVQEGSLGLLDAIDHYDPDRGADFEPYARFRVRRAIRNALTEKSRLIRLPKQVVERRRAVERAASGFLAATGRAPTVEELAGSTGLSRTAVAEASDAASAPLPLQPAVETVLADRRVSDPEQQAVEHEQAMLVDEAVAGLPPRQREIVSRHFGIGRPAETIPRVAVTLHLSEQRVRTLERDALYALRERLESAGSSTLTAGKRVAARNVGTSPPPESA